MFPFFTWHTYIYQSEEKENTAWWLVFLCNSTTLYIISDSKNVLVHFGVSKACLKRVEEKIAENFQKKNDLFALKATEEYKRTCFESRIMQKKYYTDRATMNYRSWAY